MKIIVVEDNPKHLQDAKKFFASVPDTEVVYCTTFFGKEGIVYCFRHYHRGDDLKSSWFEDNIVENVLKVDGVITDIYFPCEEEQEEYPFGLGVVFLCKKAGVPCVLNSAIWHHGKRYDWISNINRAMPLSEDFPPMVEGKISEDENQAKHWDVALSILRGLIQEKSNQSAR